MIHKRFNGLNSQPTLREEDAPHVVSFMRRRSRNLLKNFCLCGDFNHWLLRQRFPNCGSRPKSWSRSSVKWVAKVFLEIFIFCRLFV